MMQATEDLIGRGQEDGKRLFKEWFAGLTSAADAGEKGAYVFVMGSLVELLRTFDLPIVFPEINSLQTAVRKISDEYLNLAEDHGFSPDVCGYVKADYALQLKGGEHPMGTVPPPGIAVYTNACNTYIKWAEIWERMYDVPIFTLDVPGSRSAPGVKLSGTDHEADRKYVEYQLRELIELLEKVTGKPFDIDRLRDVLSVTNDMGRSWRRLLEINKGTPAVYDSMMEGTIFLGVVNALRGTSEGAKYFADLVEEMEYKLEQGISPHGEEPEKHRLIFVGVSSASHAIRSSVAFTTSSPTGAARSSARPICGSPRAGSTWTSSTISTGPWRASPRGSCSACRARSTACCSRTAP
jgi:benzoyl-CoA reductase subunit B